MPKLTATQTALITAAAARPDRQIVLPATLKGGAIQKVRTALIAAGLATQQEDRFLATDAAFAALGIQPVASPKPAKPAKAAKIAKADKSTKTSTPRAGTKQARMIEMLSKAKGATIEEIATALAWQLHTVRGAISHALGKRLGITVTSEADEKRGRVYRIAP